MTRGLDGADIKPPHWSRWFRLVDTRAANGTTIMEGPDKKPLLVLSREGEGRVGLLLSDHIWLWARGYEGGGPHLDLMRRLSHWLMKQPDLEEEALRLIVRGRDLLIERQTMADNVERGDADAAVRRHAHRHACSRASPACGAARSRATELGLWRATDGKLNALVNVGPPNPREFAEVTSTTEVLGPLAAATGGDARRLADASGGVTLPRIVAMRSSDTYPRRRLDRPEDARRQRGARHRRAADVRRPARPAAAGRRAGRDLGARRPLTRPFGRKRRLGGRWARDEASDSASSPAGSRPDTPSKAPAHELRDQQPRRIDRPRHRRPGPWRCA